jgi:hypothetical protein
MVLDGASKDLETIRVEYKPDIPEAASPRREATLESIQ